MIQTSATVKVSIFLLVVITPLVFSLTLTCQDILEMPSEKKLTVQELESIPPKEMVQCTAHLGREQLGNQEAAVIWKSVADYFGGISEIPDSVLMLLHWVTAAIAPEEYSNLTLNNIDVIQNFGLNYNLNEEQISALANRVREDFAQKEPEDFTYYDVMALRQILCGFNRSEIERIHPAAYREAALIVGKLKRCNPAVMAGFGTLAVHEDAFGPPASWPESTWELIGGVADYVTQDAPPRPTTPAPTTDKNENKAE